MRNATLGGRYQVAAGFTVETEFEVSQVVDKVTQVFSSEGEFTPDRRVTMTISAGRGEQARVPSGLVGATYEVARDKLVKAGSRSTSAGRSSGTGPPTSCCGWIRPQSSTVLENSEVTLWLPQIKKG